MDLNDLYHRRGEAVLSAEVETDDALRRMHVAQAKAYQERILRLREMRREAARP
jgi:hypothetical protein